MSKRKNDARCSDARSRALAARRLMARLASVEQEFLTQEFLAPSIEGGRVTVAIGQVTCALRVAPEDFVGWGVFQPLSHSEAILVREATMADRRRYLDRLPLIRLILCQQHRSAWVAARARQPSGRIRLDGLADVHLASDVQSFDCVKARFDGSRFWFDEPELRHNPANAAYLRESFANDLSPERLTRSGLTIEERAGYEWMFWKKNVEPLAKKASRADRRTGDEAIDFEADSVRARLVENLTHAGAELIGYAEHADGYRVTYSANGRRFTSSVNKDDLSVQVAGFCLSGEDAKFDLASLIGVAEEGQQIGEIVSVGGVDDDIDEPTYWRVHPPRE